LRDLEDKAKDKDREKSEEIIQLESERKKLREQSEKLSGKMKELE